MKFILKIIRNAFILAGLMFVSTFATGTLTYELCKPVLIFFLGYIFTELAHHYKLMPNNKKANMTLIL